MNPYIKKLQPYPFQRLKELCGDVTPNPDYTSIDLSIGEPKHEPPAFVLEALREGLQGVSKYPPTPGSPALRETIASWVINRFDLPADSIEPSKHLLPVNGTREALFAIAQCLFDPAASKPLVAMPNPFYQIYEGAALLAGAEPLFYNTPASSHFQPAIDNIEPMTWKKCQLLYLCTPGNPSGAIVPQATLQRLIELAVEHDFVIVSDECYSEIYPDDNSPPIGLLQAAARMGNTRYQNCIVFNSLSKRSNLPGLRSGFVAGQAELIRAFLLYRTYHGCAMPVHTDAASAAAWSDEQHVKANRQRYRKKYNAVLPVLQDKLSIGKPDAGFFLWPQLNISDTEFTRTCLADKNVKILPGSYLSREVDGHNPGHGHIRMALVAPQDQCIEAMQRIADLL